jgi:hypothetical protein
MYILFIQKKKHGPAMGISTEQRSGHSRTLGFKRLYAED